MLSLSLELEDSKVCDIEHRQNEVGRTYFRSDRFYSIDAKFYFSTREGAEIGPYESKVDAAEGLGRFIDSIAQDRDITLAKKIALSGNWAVTMYQ